MLISINVEIWVKTLGGERCTDFVDAIIHTNWLPRNHLIRPLLVCTWLTFQMLFFPQLICPGTLPFDRMKNLFVDTDILYYLVAGNIPFSLSENYLESIYLSDAIFSVDQE